jgi:hypothetical protein
LSQQAIDAATLLYFRPIAGVLTAIVAGVLTNLAGVTERPAGVDPGNAHASDGDQERMLIRTASMRMTMTIITPKYRERPPPEARATPSSAL